MINPIDYTALRASVNINPLASGLDIASKLGQIQLTRQSIEDNAAKLNNERAFEDEKAALIEKAKTQVLNHDDWKKISILNPAQSAAMQAALNNQTPEEQKNNQAELMTAYNLFSSGDIGTLYNYLKDINTANKGKNELKKQTTDNLLTLIDNGNIVQLGNVLGSALYTNVGPDAFKNTEATQANAANDLIKSAINNLDVSNPLAAMDSLNKLKKIYEVKGNDDKAATISSIIDNIDKDPTKAKEQLNSLVPKNLAEIKTQAEIDKLNAERDKNNRENNPTPLENIKTQSEIDKINSERNKNNRENNPTPLENTKTQAEIDKINAERNRNNREYNPTPLENTKTQAEIDRINAERNRNNTAAELEKQKQQGRFFTAANGLLTEANKGSTPQEISKNIAMRISALQMISPEMSESFKRLADRLANLPPNKVNEARQLVEKVIKIGNSFINYVNTPIGSDEVNKQIESQSITKQNNINTELNQEKLDQAKLHLLPQEQQKDVNKDFESATKKFQFAKDLNTLANKIDFDKIDKDWNMTWTRKGIADIFGGRYDLGTSLSQLMATVTNDMLVDIRALAPVTEEDVKILMKKYGDIYGQPKNLKDMVDWNKKQAIVLGTVTEMGALWKQSNMGSLGVAMSPIKIYDTIIPKGLLFTDVVKKNLEFFVNKNTKSWLTK